MNTGKKITGGRYKPSRKKKKYELGRTPRIVKINKIKIKHLRTLGGNKKQVLLSTDIANIINKNKKAKKAKILTVVETKANRFWARQNRLVKGAVIKTDLGNARITNRPSQEGSVQAVLISDSK